MIEIRDRFYTSGPIAANVAAMHNRTLPAATVVLFALGYPLGALTLADISPFLLIVLRFVASAVLAWTIVAIRRPSLPRGRVLRWALAGGLLVQGVQFLGLYWGLAHGVSAGIGALVIAMNPVATAVLGRVLFRATENRWGLLALLSGTIGVVAACLPRVLADPAVGPGIGAVLVGLSGLSAGSIMQGRILGSVDPWVFTAIGVTVSIPFAGVLALCTPQHIDDPVRGLTVLAVLVVDSALAMAGYAACVRRSGARSASVLFALIPTIAVIASWVLLHDRLDATILLALTCGALACVAQSRATRTHTRAEPHVSAPYPAILGPERAAHRSG